tara:strand:- start:3033 stop:4379 length:1347 start_codon:yes stop_codon:yes gene_type:complete
VRLTERWYDLRPHAEQRRLWESSSRFRVVPAGRRSGKTELAKRELVRCSLAATWPEAWFVAAAPTRDQAKRIYWIDLKKLVPPAMLRRVSESELTVHLVNGASISVVGMDKPDRIEGRTLDGIVLDEYGNMKPSVWAENVRPALSTSERLGWAWLIGVPEGRNHYYNLATHAPTAPDWDLFTWPSADILDPAEIEAARQELDSLTFQQEYEASFLDFAGRAYYGFERHAHASRSLKYDPSRPLVLAFDFNVEPGIAAVLQELEFPDLGWCTCVIGEVWIPRNSNTPAVCRRLAQDWAKHSGDVLVYGDATGGARGTAKVSGSDWDLIKAELRPVFGERLKFRVPRANPRERSRVNAVNSRLRTADGAIHMLVDPEAAPHVIDDLEGVTLLEGGSGEIDKRRRGPSHSEGSGRKHAPQLTHLTDAIGYYILRAHPPSTGVPNARAVSIL